MALSEEEKKEYAQPRTMRQAMQQAVEAKGAGMPAAVTTGAPNVIPEADKIGPTPLAVASKGAALERNIEPLVAQAANAATPPAAPAAQPRNMRQAMQQIAGQPMTAAPVNLDAGMVAPPRIAGSGVPTGAQVSTNMPSATVTATPASTGRGKIVRPTEAQAAGAGWMRNEQTGEVLTIDPSRKVAAFDKSGMPIDPANVQKINTQAARGMVSPYSFQGSADAAQRFNSAVAPGEYSPEAQAARAKQKEQFDARNGRGMVKLSQIEEVVGAPLGAFPKEQRPQLVNSALHYLGQKGANEASMANASGLSKHREALLDAKIDMFEKGIDAKQAAKAQVSPETQARVQQAIAEVSATGVNDNNVEHINNLRKMINEPPLVKTGKGDKIKYVPMSDQQPSGQSAATSWLKGTGILKEQPAA